MKKGMIVGGGITALIASAGLGGMAIAGGGDSREAGSRIVAEPMTATERGGVARAGKASITTFYIQQAVVPEEGAGTVVGPQCPDNEGKAIGGGAATEEGIVLSYLSQLRPNGERRGNTYWVGVDDNSSDPENAGNGAIVEVHCAKGLKVNK